MLCPHVSFETLVTYRITSLHFARPDRPIIAHDFVLYRFTPRLLLFIDVFEHVVHLLQRAAFCLRNV
jgi:hypothetical protein